MLNCNNVRVVKAKRGSPESQVDTWSPRRRYSVEAATRKRSSVSVQKRTSVFVCAVQFLQILLELPCHQANLLDVFLFQRRASLGRVLREAILCQRDRRLKNYVVTQR